MSEPASSTELLQDLHPEHHMTSSAMLQDIVIGLSDYYCKPFRREKVLRLCLNRRMLRMTNRAI